MARLNSGLVLAAGYAVKLRKALFGQMGSYIKKDKEWSGKVAYYAATLNRALFAFLVEDLKIDKLDVIRITIDYDIDEANKAINWRWDSLKIEIYKRVPPESYSEMLKSFIAKAPELAIGLVKYTISKTGETFDGDIVYTVKIGDKEIGACIITLVDEKTILLKKAAVLEPTSAIFDRARIDLNGRTIEDALLDRLAKVMQQARHVSHEEALNLVNTIRSRIEAKPIERPLELESEEW